MRRYALLVALALGAPLAVYAGGIMGSDAPSRIPIPAEEFSATVEDAAGVELEVRRVTFNGEIFFYGVLGDAQVTVPFERIASARVEPSDVAGHVVLFATMTDQTTARILLEDDMPLYGEATFGNYKIEASKLRRVSFRR